MNGTRISSNGAGRQALA